jgi:catechol 2,3-dioxygenase-like lactoylglutathione lyase family enzyme
MNELGISVRFVTMRTKDLAAARTFYEGALRLPVTDVDEGEFFQVRCGNVELCVDLIDPDAEDEPVLILGVADLGPVVSALEAEGVDIKMGRSGRYATMRDPDGNVLVIEER